MLCGLVDPDTIPPSMSLSIYGTRTSTIQGHRSQVTGDDLPVMYDHGGVAEGLAGIRLLSQVSTLLDALKYPLCFHSTQGVFVAVNEKSLVDYIA